MDLNIQTFREVHVEPAKCTILNKAILVAKKKRLKTTLISIESQIEHQETVKRKTTRKT